MKLHWAALAAVIALSGCAFTPQTITISPRLEVATSRIGADHAVGLLVVDERLRQTLVTRTGRDMGAEMTIEGDLQAIVRNALADGLARQGFKPQAGAGPEGRDLRVEIRNLDYRLVAGFWAGTLRVEVGLKAICIRDRQWSYEQLHRGAFDKTVAVVQGQEANNAYVSQAVSKAVNSLLNDQQLIACLSQ